MVSSTEAWLRLANVQLPARSANALIERFGAPEAVFGADVDELAAAADLTDNQVARLSDPSYAPTARQLAYMERPDVRIVTLQDVEYPANLREIPDPPAALFVRGAFAETDRFSVGVVGSRQATAYGRSVAARISRDLVSAGLTVVSGGAIGIDSAAHRAATEAGGRTIAVLGCGLDIDYPREHRVLFAQIAEGQGALVTEYPPGAQPEAWRFPLRNRLISGLSMGTVVVEAGERSGALLTSSSAAEQGREVMAVPGNVDRPSSKGCNALLKDGAALIEDAQDILRTLGILTLESPRPAEQPALPLGPELPETQRRLLENLNLTPKHIDALAVDVRIAPVDVSVQLTLLELSGFVRRLPGNCYIRVL